MKYVDDTNERLQHPTINPKIPAHIRKDLKRVSEGQISVSLFSARTSRWFTRHGLCEIKTAVIGEVGTRRGIRVFRLTYKGMHALGLLLKEPDNKCIRCATSLDPCPEHDKKEV